MFDIPIQNSASEFRAHIANCLIIGDESSDADGQSLRNVVNMNLDGRPIQLVQRPELVDRPLSDFNGLSLYTSDLIIRDLEPKDLDYAKQLSREVAILLSLATASEVWDFGYTYPGVQPIREVAAFRGQARSFKPVINPRIGRDIAHYLEQTITNFRSLRQTRQLDIAFDYFVLSQLEKPIEISLVITFVLLENLKATYATKRGFPYRNDYFWKSSSKRWTFKDLLQEMLGDVGMTSDLSEVVRLRNNIIHSGITQLDLSERIAIYTFAQDLIREYLLRILGYTGEYYRFSDNTILRIS